MDKIKIIDNQIIDNNNNIIINDYNKLPLNMDKDSLFIYIPNDTELILDASFNSKHQNIIILIDKNSKVKLFEDKYGNNLVGNIKYILLDNTHLIINKYCHAINLEENIDIELNGIGAKIEYYFSTISETNKNYNINIYHHNKQTNSNIICHGISLDNAILTLNLNGYIDKGQSGSIINQDSKIIVLGDNKSTINPKLYINENDVEAKHSAVIGRFSDKDLFYLKSRGIDEKIATRMLAKGFLLGILEMPEAKNFDILRNIDTYWE